MTLTGAINFEWLDSPPVAGDSGQKLKPMPKKDPSMPDYNPDSLDAVVSRIESKIDTFVREAQEWRAQHALEISSLKNTVQAHERMKYWLLGMAAAAGAASGKILTTIFGKP